MKFPSVRFVFDRKHKASQSSRGLVQIEVTSQGKRKWISTGVKLYADQWDERRMVINDVDMVRLNRDLTEQRARIEDWLRGLERNGEVFEFDKLNRFLSARQVSDSFIEYVERRIGERKDIREVTRRGHTKLPRVLKEFGKIVYFTDLTRQNIVAFDGWLRQRGLQQVSVHSYHKLMKGLGSLK